MSARVEHFLFAPGGNWGLVTSDGQCALVGGPASLIADVRESLDYDQEKALRAFVADWREMQRASASVDWVPTLLDHVLGAGKGSRLRADS